MIWDGPEEALVGQAHTGSPAPIEVAQPPISHAQPLALITMDSAGLVQDLNAEAEELTGYAREEAVGASLAALVVPERLGTAHEAGLRRFRDRGEAPLVDHRIEVPLRRRDGSEILVELTITKTGPSTFAGLLRPVGQPSPVPVASYLSEEFYRTLIERAPFLITVVDADEHERWHSPTHWAAPAIEGGLAALVHPADQSLAREALRNASADGLADPVELRVLAPDGSWHAVAVQAADLRDNPAVRGTVLYGQDVSRARAAEQRVRVEAARMNILIESLGVGVLLQDEHGHVVLSNAAFVEMFALGLRPDRLRGTPLRADSGQYADREAATRRTQETLTRGRPRIGDEFALTDGRVVERDYVPITLDGTTLGHLWVFRDVTAQADARRALEERNRILTELSALKTEFVTVVSHELRTPLTSIATFAGMADDESLGADGRRQAIDVIRRNADRMLALVADLVLLAKLESGEIVLSTDAVDFASLVRNACSQVASDHLAVTVQNGPAVAGDAPLLCQAVATVVGVVAAAGDADASVTVVADTGGGGGTTAWTLSVRTPTAEPASAERLLSTRLPHPDVPGERRTGALALMLTRQIAARHGGELATSVEGCAITVTLRVPAAR